jgi:DNA-binding transcriptional ArsR family regulator
MANSTQLIEAVSRATGVASESLVVHMRILREMGLISVAGRGTSAAAMTARDAARLLMAVAGSNNVKEAANAAITFSRLPAHRRELKSPAKTISLMPTPAHWQDGPSHWSVKGDLHPGLDPQAIRKKFGLTWLPIGASFEDALIGLIERSLSGDLFPKLDQTDFIRAQASLPRYRKRLWVSLYRPEAYASITYLAERIVYESVSFHLADRRHSPFADRREERTGILYAQKDFNDETLEIVADALQPSRQSLKRRKTLHGEHT